MKKLLLLTLLATMSISAFAEDDIIGFRLDGKLVQSQADAKDFIKEIKKLVKDEDYEVEADLCVLYGNENTVVNERLDDVLEEAGYSLELEGIYGSFGDHMFEIRDLTNHNVYLGAISGIYKCENNSPTDAVERSIDDLVGEYNIKGEAESRFADATITKVLVAQPTLFDPARYEYRLSLDGNFNGVYFDDVEMTVNLENNTLSITGDRECDDPGCYYFENLNVTAKISRKGNPYIIVEFNGAYEDEEAGEDDPRYVDFEGKEVYFKKK